MKFADYATLREAQQTAEIDQIFQQTEKEIGDLFDQVYRGVERMIRTSQKAQLPAGMADSIIKDLSRIAQKVRGTGGVAKESVTVDAFVKNISEAVTAVAGLGQTGSNDEGMPTYDFRSTLTNAKNLVMQRMEQLRASVLKSIGMVSDIHKGVGELGGRVGDIHQRVVSQLSNNERESIQDALAQLGKALSYYKRTGLNDRAKRDIRIYAGPRSELSFDPNDLQSVLGQVDKIKNPKAVQTTIDGKPGPVIDLTDRNSWLQLMDIFQSRNPVAPPDAIKNVRKLKVREPKKPWPGVN